MRLWFKPHTKLFFLNFSVGQMPPEPKVSRRHNDGKREKKQTKQNKIRRIISQQLKFYFLQFLWSELQGGKKENTRKTTKSCQD